MSTKKKPQNGKLIAFYVPDEMFAALGQRAIQHGFASAALFTRAVMERQLDVSELDTGMHRVTEIRSRVQKNVLRALQSTFASLTVEELMADDE